MKDLWNRCFSFSSFSCGSCGIYVRHVQKCPSSHIMESTYAFNLYLQLNPSTAPLVSDFLNALIKAHKCKERLHFLKRCFEEKVIPKSLLPDRLTNCDNLPFGDYEKITLEKCITATKDEVWERFKLSQRCKAVLDRTIPREDQRLLFGHCYRVLSIEVEKVRQNHNRKLNGLIRTSFWTVNYNPECVINLSDKVLDDDTLRALGYGISFAINQDPDPIKVGSAIYQLERHYDRYSGLVRGLLYSTFFKKAESSYPLRYKNALSKLRKDSDLHFTKADKSSAIVIMNKEDYDNKVYELLGDVNTYKKLRSDPNQKVASEFNKKMKRLLEGKNELIRKVSVMNPTLAYMYGLVKTHKPNNPIRPIISSVGSVSYKLSKYLAKLLSPFVGTVSDSFILNSEDLTNKIKTLNLNYRYKLVSFDVKSLFTNVPLDDILNFLPEIIGEELDGIPCTKIVELIKLCVENSCFTFNGEFFSQTFGIAMGNPLSPILANLYMEYFETKLLPSVKDRNVKWLRYVDDILCFWPVDNDIDVFLDRINGLAPSIKFTFETESNGHLPFLDVEIIRENNILFTKVYRKPTNICSYVHYYSDHHINVKRSVFISMFIRAYKICDPPFLDDEIDNIFRIGQKLQYPKRVLSLCHTKARKKVYNPRVNQVNQENTKTIVLPYHVNFLDIIQPLKVLGINVAFTYNNTIKSQLLRNRPKDTPGSVYEIPCQNCDSRYIGTSGKALSDRIKQHQYKVRIMSPDSGIFQHKFNHNHHINWDGASNLIHKVSLSERIVFESCLISASYEKNMNLSYGHFKCDPLINSLVCKRIK